MNNSIILSVIFGSGTLVGVIVTLVGSYFLKKLELKDREKERKFKIEEKMIEKSIDAHMELFSRAQRFFGLVNSYYAADGTLVPPDKKSMRNYTNYCKSLQSGQAPKAFS